MAIFELCACKKYDELGIMGIGWRRLTMLALTFYFVLSARLGARGSLTMNVRTKTALFHFNPSRCLHTYIIAHVDVHARCLPHSRSAS